jgi:hypothetical protein
VFIKGQRYSSAEEVTAKVMTALKEVSKNSFQECFPKLYKCWQKHFTAPKLYKRWQKRLTAQGNYPEGTVE